MALERYHFLKGQEKVKAGENKSHSQNKKFLGRTESQPSVSDNGREDSLWKVMATSALTLAKAADEP